MLKGPMLSRSIGQSTNGSSDRTGPPRKRVVSGSPSNGDKSRGRAGATQSSDNPIPRKGSSDVRSGRLVRSTWTVSGVASTCTGGSPSRPPPQAWATACKRAERSSSPGVFSSRITRNPRSDCPASWPVALMMRAVAASPEEFSRDDEAAAACQSRLKSRRSWSHSSTWRPGEDLESDGKSLNAWRHSWAMGRRNS